MKKTLALDLGTHTGIVYTTNFGTLVCETWTLASAMELKAQRTTRLDRRGDIRVRKLFHSLCSLLKDAATEGKPYQLVAFEDVQFSKSTAQTQLWSSFRAAVWLAADMASLCGPFVAVDCVPVMTLKKFAGASSADKDRMRKLLSEKHPEILKPNMDDNAVDAAWIYLWANHTHR